MKNKKVWKRVQASKKCASGYEQARKRDNMLRLPTVKEFLRELG